MGKASTLISVLGSPVADANPFPVTLTPPSSSQTSGYSSSQTKTRPSDTPTYTALDVMSESASSGTDWDFDLIGPSAGKVVFTRATLRVDLAAVTSGMTTFRMHLYSSAPTAINDDAAYDLPSADRAKYLGYITLPQPVDLGATLWSDTETNGLPIRLQATLVGTSVYGILQSVGGFVAASATVYTVGLHTVAV
jgi:hypothetical protein